MFSCRGFDTIPFLFNVALWIGHFIKLLSADYYTPAQKGAHAYRQYIETTTWQTIYFSWILIRFNDRTFQEKVKRQYALINMYELIIASSSVSHGEQRAHDPTKSARRVQ